jgi:hypothetical protein
MIRIGRNIESERYHLGFWKPTLRFLRRPPKQSDGAYGHGDVFFWLMPISIDGIAWPEKRNEVNCCRLKPAA